MWLNRFRLFMAVFVLVAFVSQAFAVADNHCDDQMGHSESSGLAVEMSHQHHGMSHDMDDMQPSSDPASEDCCSDQLCQSFDCASASSTGMAAVAQAGLYAIMSVDTVASIYNDSYPSAAVSALFRPPIFR